MRRSSALTNVLEHVETCAGARRATLYLVGGFLRDELLDRHPASRILNIDLAVASGALGLAEALAKSLGGTAVRLDETLGSARVVVSRDADVIELDLTDFRGSTLEADLGKRDFAINAMAIPLATWLSDPRWTERLVDPLGGACDLASKRLRACFAETFHEDPVRILRAFRFAIQLDFAMEASLEPRMAEAARALSEVSGERLRDELFVILDTDRAGWALRRLDAVGALTVVLPELNAGRGMEQGGYHHLSVLEHQLETVSQCDELLADFSGLSPELREPLSVYCAEPLIPPRSRKALLKFAGLLHDVGKPSTRQQEPDGTVSFIGHERIGSELIVATAERLRLSNRETTMLERLIRHHLRPGHLSREPTVSPRAIFRFYRDLEDDGPGCLLMWWADRLATRGPSSRLEELAQQRRRLEELLGAYYFKAAEVVKPPRLIDGHQLMRSLGLAPGPLIGTLLTAIEEAQVEGKVRSPDEALALAQKMLQEHGAT